MIKGHQDVKIGVRAERKTVSARTSSKRRAGTWKGKRTHGCTADAKALEGEMGGCCSADGIVCSLEEDETEEAAVEVMLLL